MESASIFTCVTFPPRASIELFDVGGSVREELLSTCREDGPIGVAAAMPAPSSRIAHSAASRCLPMSAALQEDVPSRMLCLAERDGVVLPLQRDPRREFGVAGILDYPDAFLLPRVPERAYAGEFPVDQPHSLLERVAHARVVD